MNAVEKARPSAVEVTPMAMLQIAVQQGADLDKLEKLMALQERWEANNARKAYVAATAAFKANPPTIVKNKHVRFQTSKGVTEYDHATHDHVTNTIGEALSKHGLSHRWEISQEQNRITVTCILQHIDGHSERTSMEGNADDSGGKNSIQAIGSAVTYLQRYTLLAATGMSSRDNEDDDGLGAGGGLALITDKQAADLRALATEVGANEAAFLKVCKVDSYEKLPASKYEEAVRRLREKGKEIEKEREREKEK